MTKTTAVLYCHNEVRNLGFMLPSFFRLNVDKYLILLDRCNDGSFQLIYDIALVFHKVSKCHFIRIHEIKNEYETQLAYLMSLALKNSSRYVLICASDIILDYELINSQIPLMYCYGAISFILKPKNFTEKLTYLLYLIKGGFAGVFMFDKELLDLSSISEKLKSTKYEDTLIFRSIKKRSNTLTISSENEHLRPVTLKEFLKRRFRIFEV